MNNQNNFEEYTDLSWSENPNDLMLSDKEKDDDDKKKIIIPIIKASSMVVVAFALLVFVGVAWFALNKNVGTNGLEVSVSSASYYLRVRENDDTSYFSKYFTLFQKADNTFGTGTQETSGTAVYYKTGVENNKIVWRLDSDDLDPNTNIYTVGLRPSSAGKLEFEVVPEADGELDIDFSFNVRGFTATYPTQEEITAGTYASDDVKTLTEIFLPTESGAALTDAQKALKYIGGHILFFENCSNGVYSGFLGTDDGNVYCFRAPSATANTPIPVTIHYVWVNTIDQFILKSTDDPADAPLLADDSTERGKLILYIQQNADAIFDGSASGSATSVTYESYKASAELQKTLNDGYNAADQAIGVNLDYILVDMNATQITESDD